MKMKLADLTVDIDINPRRKLDDGYVEDLRDFLDEVPPVIAVHILSEGIKLLADGFHRYEAARREDRVDIDVDLRPGDRATAEDLAVLLNLHHGKKLTMEERHAAIRDFMGRHSEMSQREAAKALGVSARTIERVAKPAAMPHPLQFSQERDLQESGLPEQTQQALREHAPVKKTGGKEVRAYPTRDTLQRKIKALKSADIPEDYKAGILRGEKVPILFTEAGEPVVAQDDVVEQAARAVQDDVGVQFAKGWLAAGRLLPLEPLDIIDSLSGDVMMLRSIANECPDHIDWFKKLARLAAEKLELRQEVNSA